MNGTLDIGRTTVDDGGELDPRKAAQLLEQTGRRTRRELTPNPPWLELIVAGPLVFFLYGCLYMSVRGQHPYVGPRGTWVVVMVLGLIASSLLRLAFFDRAVSGLSGTSVRRMAGLGATIVGGVVCVYVLDGALAHAHVGTSITLGVFDASAPLLVLAAIWATMSAYRENWVELGSAIALMGVVAGAAFAGPIGVWGVIAVGGSLVLMPHALVTLWQQRR